MSLYKVDFSLFKLAQSVKLKHLNEALRCFFYNAYFVLKTKELNTSVKVVKHFINQLTYLTLVSLHYFIKLGENLVNDIKKCFSAPVLLVSQHVLNYCMSLIDYFELSQFLEIQLFRLNNAL